MYPQAIDSVPTEEENEVMSNTIQIRVRHLDTDETYTEVHTAHNSEREITPAAAVTIASWWQAPGSTGYILAGFASGAKVNRHALLGDISDTRRDEGYHSNTMTADDQLALDMLSTFVQHYEEI